MNKKLLQLYPDLISSERITPFRSAPKQAHPKNTLFKRSLLPLLLFALLTFAMGEEVKGQQTFFDLSTGNYSQDFSDISNWTNNYASGIGANNWRVAATATNSTVNNATVFVSGTTGGIQRGSENLVLLATGTNSAATDLLLDMTGRVAGTISLDWVKIVNSANASPRSSDLKIQYSIDNGASFTDLTGYTIPRVFNNDIPESGSLTNIPLPSAINNIPQVVIRFYVWNNGQTGGSGNRPKIAIDNISITSDPATVPLLAATPTTITGLSYANGLGPSASQSFTLTGSNLTPAEGTLSVSVDAGFEFSFDDEVSWFGDTDSPQTFSYSGGSASREIFVRLAAGLTEDTYTGNITVSGGGATSPATVALSGEVTPPPPALTAFEVAYTQNFSGFNSADTFPIGWEPDEVYTYGGAFGTGTAGGFRGEGVLGFQLTGNAPNNAFEATLTLLNDTGETIQALDISYLGRAARTDQTGTPKWDVRVNGNVVEALEYSTAAGTDQTIEAVVAGLNIPNGESFTVSWFTTSTGTSGTRRQIGVTDVSITAVEPPAIVTPVFSLEAGTFFEDQTVFVSNFSTISGLGGSVFFTLDGSVPDASSSEYDNNTGILVEDGAGAVTLRAIAIAGTSESDVASAVYTFPVNIADIQTLRQQPTGSTIYRLANESTLIGQTNFRNTKFFQDDSGFGIQIDDAPNGIFEPGLITTAYQVGDQVAALVGTLALFQGQLRLTPVIDFGAPTSSGVTVEPVVRTLNNLTSNDQARLVMVTDVTFTGSGNFGGGGSTTTITATGGNTNNVLFRNIFGDSNITGAAIPEGSVVLVGVVQETSDGLNIGARNLDDLSGQISGINIPDGDEVDLPGNLNLGNLTIPGGSTVNIPNGGNISITPGGTFANAGTLNLSGNAQLRVQAGGSLTNTGTLNIGTGGSGDAQLQNENGGLTIASGSFLINDGTINGEVTFERIITSPSYSGDNPTGHWVGLSSPTADTRIGSPLATIDPLVPEFPQALLSSVWTQGFPGADDDREASDTNVFIVTDGDYARPGLTLPVGKGMLAFLFENRRLNFLNTEVDFTVPFSVKGNLNDDGNDFNFPLSGTGAWNLLGNPFAASLNWQEFLGSDLNAYAYILDPETQQYLAVEPNPLGGDVLIGTTTDVPFIAPFQAFWVKADEGETGSLTAPETTRGTETGNGELFNTNPTPVFSLRLNADEMQSTTAFRFGEGFSASFANTDAYYLSGLTTTFAFTYSLKDETPTMINALPLDLTEAISFPIAAGAYVQGNAFTGEATFTWPAFENIPSDWTITLTDTKTGAVIDLRDEVSYSFLMEAPAGLMAKVESVFDFQYEGTPVMHPMFTGTRFLLTIDPEMPTSAPVTGELPRALALSQNYPNPFNPTTMIRFEMPAAEEVRLEVYNVQGQRVAVLVNGTVQAGVHNVSFDASALSSGVYLYRLQAGNQVLTRKMTLIK